MRKETNEMSASPEASVKPKMKVLRWLLLSALVVAVASFVVVLVIRPCVFFDSKTTILIVRHAEKDTTIADSVANADGSFGPPLTSAGQARAQELAHVAGEAGVTVIYHTQYLRTRQTIEPLDNLVSGNTTQMFEADRTNDLVNDILNQHRGETIMIASHSNKVPEIIERLGGPHLPNIADNDFDNLYVITVTCKNPPKVVLLKYGQPT
jgi:2,3-bisphosphoglycerate-dependent phosphoglycerate mutase